MESRGRGAAWDASGEAALLLSVCNTFVTLPSRNNPPAKPSAAKFSCRYTQAGEILVALARRKGAVFGAHSVEAMVLVVRVGLIELAAGLQMFGGITALGFGEFHAAMGWTATGS